MLVSVIRWYVCCVRRVMTLRPITTSMTQACRSPMSLWASHCSTRAFYSFQKAMNNYQASLLITTVRGYTLPGGMPTKTSQHCWNCAVLSCELLNMVMSPPGDRITHCWQPISHTVLYTPTWQQAHARI